MNLFRTLFLSFLLLLNTKLALAQISIPVDVLHYSASNNTSYVFPKSDSGDPFCDENKYVASRYQITGTIQGHAAYGFSTTINRSTTVTLYERFGNGTAKLKITPLGILKHSYYSWKVPPTFSGRRCVDSGSHNYYVYAEKDINSTINTISLWHTLNRNSDGGNPDIYYTLAFELLDADKVAPGFYYAPGGYQFKSDEIEMTVQTQEELMDSPIIPNLSLAVAHVFKIDMPYTSVDLKHVQENSDRMEGSISFWALSNESYSITLKCTQANIDNTCNFDNTSVLSLSADLEFPTQNFKSALKHDESVNIDAREFYSAYRPYKGVINFMLDNIKKVQPGIYDDQVTLVFEANF